MATERLNKARNNKQPSASVGFRRICVVGLGYVRLPIAVESDQPDHMVTGFDINPDQPEHLTSGHDPTGDVGSDGISPSNVALTTDGIVPAGSTNWATHCVFSQQASVAV